MSVEGRKQVIRGRITRVNGRPEELAGPDGRRQPSMGGTSRVSREAQARICEGLGCNSRAYSASGCDSLGLLTVTFTFEAKRRVNG